MAAMLDSKLFSREVTVMAQAWPTATSLMSYSSTRKDTFMWAKSATCTSASPWTTLSPCSTLTVLTRPSNSADTVSPLASRTSRSPSCTASPAATYSVRTVLPDSAA